MKEGVSDSPSYNMEVDKEQENKKQDVLGRTCPPEMYFRMWPSVQTGSLQMSLRVSR